MNFSIYRRSITSRLAEVAPRFHPYFSHIIVKDDENCPEQVFGGTQAKTSVFRIQKFYHNLKSFGISGQSHDKNSFLSPFSTCLLGSSFGRYYSTSSGEGSENITFITDVAELLSDKSSEVAASQVPLVNEVAIAAADSAYPVAALQYFIDGIHSFTGFNWWASIVITTLFIRTATLPLHVTTLKSTAKLSQLRPQMEEIRQQTLNSKDPKTVAEGQRKMKDFLNEHNVNPFSPLKGLFIQGPIFASFYFAISNMVEKVPSFKTGGALWFTDLTTADSFYVLPVLTAVSFLLTVELNAQQGMEGNSMAGTMKKFSRLLAVLTVPFTMGFPKAIFCYWATSNLFSLCYALVIRRPQVKRLLGIPEFVPPPSTKIPKIPFFGGPNSVIGQAQAVLEQAKKLPPSTKPVSADQKPINSVIGKGHAVVEQAKRSPPSTKQVSADQKPINSVTGKGHAVVEQDKRSPPSTKQVSADQKPTSTERKISSSAVINQRIQNLERKVKGRKKSKR